MKKFSLILFSLLAVQILNAQVKFGVTAGVAMANYKFKASGITFNADSKAGLTVGFLADIGVSDNFSVQPALNFIQKGTKVVDKSDPNDVVTDKMTVNMLELPINFLYNTHGSSGNFFAGAGPSIAFALSGKDKTTYSGGSPSEEYDLEFGNTDNDDMKGLDFGGNLVAGYTFSNGIMVAVNYNFGFSNLVPKPVSDESQKSNYFGIRLGYMFGGSDKSRK